MLEFIVNEYITLKLENSETNIYVNSKLFNQCKYVLTRKKVYNLTDIFEFDSIDDLAEQSETSVKRIESDLIDVQPETRFWVHCSNLQVWVENDYDSRLLHSNLAFPLLKALVDLGDPKAKRVFKEEIARRYAYGSFSTQQFLQDEGFLEFLPFEELINGVLGSKESNLFFEIIDFMKNFGIIYELVLNLDEDRCRHRTNPNKRFFTIFKGQIYDLEFDLFEESFNFFIELSTFKGLTNLILNVSEMQFKSIKGISKLKFESIKRLKINIFSPIEILDIFNKFPNLILLQLYNQSLGSVKLEGFRSLTSLKEFKELNLYNCLYNDHISNELSILKEKGVRMLIKNK